MPARKVQTLLRNPNERKHRSHRSKRGRARHKNKSVLWKQNVKEGKIKTRSKVDYFKQKK